MDRLEFYKCKKNQPIITNPMSFKLGVDTVPTDDGIFSNKLFGTDRKSRMEIRGRIVLNTICLHPLVATRVFERMGKNQYLALLEGHTEFVIYDGELYKIDEIPKDAKENKISAPFKGLKGFRRHIEEYKPKKTKSITRAKLIDFLVSHGEEIFISDLNVIPPYFRDYNITSNGVVSDPVNAYYESIISYSNSINAGVGDEGMLTTYLQKTLNELYRYLRDKMRGKRGLIQRSMLGRDVNYASRTVISAPPYNSKKIGDGMVNSRRYGIPLDIMSGTFHPFFLNEISSFMLTEYETEVNIEEIREMIERFNGDWTCRLDPVEFTDRESGEVKTFDITIHNIDTDQDENRKMTILDLMYIAGDKIAETKTVNTIRFPIMKTQNILSNHVAVLSTNKTINASYKNRIYRWYPDIEFTRTQDLLSSFCQTMQIHNSHLNSYDGDFDGDKLAIIGNMTDEANMAAEKLMNDPATVFNLLGESYRTSDREAAQSLYMMTKPSDDSSKTLSKEDQKFLHELSWEDFDMDVIAKFILSTEGKPKYKINDIMSVSNQSFPNDVKLKSIKTTFGRYMFNKIVFGNIEHEYQNKRMKRNDFDGIVNELGFRVINGKLEMDEYLKFIDRAEDLRFRLSGVLNVSLNESIMTLSPKLKAKRDKLIEENIEALENGDMETFERIKKEVMDEWAKDNEGTPQYDMYNSGAKPKVAGEVTPTVFALGYKPTIDNGIQFVRNGYNDGLSKKESIINAELAAIGARARAKDTAVGGYLAKIVSSIYQAVRVTASDCGSMEGLDGSVVTMQNFKYYEGRYIIKNGKVRLLEKKDVGTKFKLRGPMYCKTKDGYCEVCTGDIYKKLGIKNIGLTLTGPAGQLSQAALSKSHQLDVKIGKINNIGEFMVLANQNTEQAIVESFIEKYEGTIFLPDVDIIKDLYIKIFSRIKPVSGIPLELEMADLRSIQVLINNGVITKKLIKAMTEYISQGNLLGKEFGFTSISSRKIKEYAELLLDNLTFSDTVKEIEREWIFDDTEKGESNELELYHMLKVYDDIDKNETEFKKEYLKFIKAYFKIFEAYYENTTHLEDIIGLKNAVLSLI